MTARALILGLAGALAVAVGSAAASPPYHVKRPSGPFIENSIGPLSDVTAHWRRYQPARAFCIKPNAPQYTPGGNGATDTGRDPACRRSGFPASAKGLVRIAIHTPALCRGCQRLFIDFSKIPRTNHPPLYYAHGHVFYRLASANSTYTVDPVAHSPNTKNFTNDKLLAPYGSPQEQLIGLLDRHQLFGYVSDTRDFIHTKIQGPYYIGPWYLNRQGRRIHGVYLDVNVASATRYPSASENVIHYVDGFNSGQRCPSDGDAFYAGCVDWWGFSVSSVNPYARR